MQLLYFGWVRGKIGIDRVQDILDQESFPTGSHDGMAEQGFAVSDSQ